MNSKYIICVFLAAGLFYSSVMVYQCAHNSSCSVLALKVTVGENEDDLSGINKGPDPVVISGSLSESSEKKIIIITDEVDSPPTPPPPRRSH